MLITTIAGISQVPVGTKLEAIGGKILKVYEFKSGENGNGAWSLQNLKVQDATETTSVVLKNRPELSPNWEGAEVMFIAGQYKNRPSGVIVDEYNAKLRVIVNEHASIEEGDAKPSQPRQQERPRQEPQRQQEQRQAPARQQEQRQEPQRQQSQPQRQQAPARQSLQEEERQEQENARPQGSQQSSQPRQEQRQQRQEKPERTPEEKAADAKRDVLRLVSLYTICHDAAVLHSASVNSRHWHVQHPAAIGALATTLFIEANRQQVGRGIAPVNPMSLPPPTYKMGDIIKEYEAHQKQLAQEPNPSEVPAADEQDNLSAMPEKQW